MEKAIVSGSDRNSSRMTPIQTSVKPNASAAATTDPCASTAWSDTSVDRSIMKQRYIEPYRIVRWWFMIEGFIVSVMNLRDSLLASLVAGIWGFNFVVIDWGMDGVPPLLFLTLRFCVVIVPAVFVLPRPDVPWSTILGIGALMSLGQFAFLYLALDAGMAPGVAALVLQAQVVFTVFIAAMVLRERPRPLQVVGVGIGVVGLVVVAVGRGGDVALAPFGLCLLGALSWGAGNVLSRSSGVVSGLSLTVWSALVVPIPALMLALAIDGPNAVFDGLDAFGWKASVSTPYTGVLASLVGYGIFNTLLSRHRSADVVPFILLAPVRDEFPVTSAVTREDERCAPNGVLHKLVRLRRVLQQVAPDGLVDGACSLPLAS